MQTSILSKELRGWTDLTNTKREGLLTFQEDDVFVFTKVRVLAKMVTLDIAYKAYFAKLSEEVDVMTVSESVKDVANDNWKVYVNSIDCLAAQYTVFACSVKGGRVCTFEAVAQTVNDCQAFQNQFAAIAKIVDFDKLQPEVAVLEVPSGRVTVTGISNVYLKNVTDNILIFIGQNKYFIINSNKDFKRALIEKAQSEFELLQEEEEGRYTIKQEGKFLGRLELQTIKVGTESFGIMGYWSGTAESTIIENLSFEVEVFNHGVV